MIPLSESRCRLVFDETPGDARRDGGGRTGGRTAAGPGREPSRPAVRRPRVAGPGGVTAAVENGPVALSVRRVEDRTPVRVRCRTCTHAFGPAGRATGRTRRSGGTEPSVRPSGSCPAPTETGRGRRRRSSESCRRSPTPGASTRRRSRRCTRRSIRSVSPGRSPGRHEGTRGRAASSRSAGRTVGSSSRGGRSPSASRRGRAPPRRRTPRSRSVGGLAQLADERDGRRAESGGERRGRASVYGLRIDDRHRRWHPLVAGVDADGRFRVRACFGPGYKRAWCDEGDG